MPIAVHDELRSHLEMVWPGSSITPFQWTLGPIGESLPGFNVLRVSPRSEGEPWVYVSNGAARVECVSGERYEFFLLAPRESPAHVETLAMVSNFHSDPRCRLHIGKTIDIGRPSVGQEYT